MNILLMIERAHRMTSIVTATAGNFSADCAASALFLLSIRLERLRELQNQKAYH